MKPKAVQAVTNRFVDVNKTIIFLGYPEGVPIPWGFSFSGSSHSAQKAQFSIHVATDMYRKSTFPIHVRIDRRVICTKFSH